MTSQASEGLLYEGKRIPMQSLPLEAYLKLLDQRPKFPFLATNNWRGYIGEWEIVDGKLYLTDLRAMGFNKTEKGLFPEIVPNRVSVVDIFPESGGRVFADWYTGSLRCPQGEVVEYYRGEFGALYQRYLVITVESGVVTGEEVVSGSQVCQVATIERVPEPVLEKQKRLEWFRKWLKKLL